MLSGSKRVICSNIFKPITFPNLTIFYLVLQAEPWLHCVKHNGMHGQSSSVKIEAEEKTIVKLRVSTKACLVFWSFLNEKYEETVRFPKETPWVMSICCSLVVSRQSQEDQVYWSSVGSLSPSHATVELCSLSWQIHEQMAVERFVRVVVISFQFY